MLRPRPRAIEITVWVVMGLALVLVLRLHLLASRVAAGASIEEAMRAARPPIFFKEQDSYRRQLRRWSEARLRDALDRVAEAEFRMKLTGPRADTICREALFSVASMARQQL